MLTRGEIDLPWGAGYLVMLPFEFTIPGARISDGQPSMIDGDGAALVIHAAADDYRTNPSGNSGARIACGIFG